jgi:hypothetical protein
MMIKTETKNGFKVNLRVSDVLMKKMIDLVINVDKQTTSKELMIVNQFWYHMVSNNLGKDLGALGNSVWAVSEEDLSERIDLLKGCGVDVGRQVHEILWAYKISKDNAEKIRMRDTEKSIEVLCAELTEVLEECS